MYTQPEINVSATGTAQSAHSNGAFHQAERTIKTTTLVIGGGQSGLAVGYYLKKHNIPFLILDASKRVGDVWRQRWDSLKLFTPARYDGLPGMPYPTRAHYFPTKNEMADFLERYASTFDLPVRSGIVVDALTKDNDKYIVTAGQLRFEADHVVVAMSNYQNPRIPTFANELDPAVVQLHSRDYRNPDQLQPGDTLLVGAGNSGSEIAMELSRTHKVYLSGRETGNVPFRIGSKIAEHLLMPLVLKFIFHRVLTIRTPFGRKVRPKILTSGGPLIRVMPKDLRAAGVEWVPKTAGVSDGKPALQDGTVLNVKNVIWCTGFDPGFNWIKLPVLGKYEPTHRAGIVPSEPGLYFVGLAFLYSFSSTMIQGVGRDAKRVVEHMVKTLKKAS